MPDYKGKGYSTISPSRRESPISSGSSRSLNSVSLSSESEREPPKLALSDQLFSLSDKPLPQPPKAPPPLKPFFEAIVNNPLNIEAEKNGRMTEDDLVIMAKVRKTLDDIKMKRPSPPKQLSLTMTNITPQGIIDQKAQSQESKGR